MLLLAIAVAAVGTPSERACPASVERSIVQAVRERMGPATDVRLRDVECRLSAAPRRAVHAAAEPNARLGRSMRFVLRDPGESPPAAARRIGYATALVTVSVPHSRVARPVSGGARLTAADLAPAVGDPGSVPLRRLPEPSEIDGARAVRTLAPGEVITPHLVRLPPLVQRGDPVVVRIIVGKVEARGRGIAAQHGALGDVIRVINPENRRTLRARVVAAGKVEVVHGS